MKYTLLKDDNAVDVLLEDGGIVSLYHNGENMVSFYYQNRIYLPYTTIDWDKMSESKTYSKDWIGEDVWNQKMVDDALNWLAPFQDEFTYVEPNDITFTKQ